ncbi:MAG TPA: hypothetical protein VF988_15310 [Verrucomicrobiae bacterium]
MKPSDPIHDSSGESGATGLPLVHTWKGVYLWVLASFALWVALLVALTKSFS